MPALGRQRQAHLCELQPTPNKLDFPELFVLAATSLAAVGLYFQPGFGICPVSHLCRHLIGAYVYVNTHGLAGTQCCVISLMGTGSSGFESG